MAPTVKVDSTYEEEFEPDVIHVRVHMEGYGPTKQEAADAYGEALDRLLAALEKAGIERDDVRGVSFSIWQPWGKKKKRPFEYEAQQAFDVDCTEERFNAVWDALMGVEVGDRAGTINPRFSYALRDEEGARSKIVHRAVEIGRQRAVQLADAVGCDLGQIVSVQNGLDADGGYRAFSDGVMPSSTGSGMRDSQAPVFNPDAIDIDCSVCLEYELLPRG